MSTTLRTLVLNGLPLDRDDTRADFNDIERHDFVAFNTNRGDSFEEFWDRYKPMANWFSDALDRMEQLGADCRRRATLDDLSSIGHKFDLVVLISHWKPALFRRTDFLIQNPETFIERVNLYGDRKSDSEYAALIEQLQNRLNSCRSASEMASQFNEIIKNPQCLSIWLEERIESEPEFHRAAVRELIDNVFDGLILPGNRFELRDALHLPTVFAEAIPIDWVGTIDCTICQSDLLVSIIRDVNASDSIVCVETETGIQPGPRLELTIESMECATETCLPYSQCVRMIFNELTKK